MTGILWEIATRRAALADLLANVDDPERLAQVGERAPAVTPPRRSGGAASS